MAARQPLKRPGKQGGIHGPWQYQVHLFDIVSSTPAQPQGVIQHARLKGCKWIPGLAPSTAIDLAGKANR